MTRRKKTILIIVAVLLVIVVSVYFIFFRKDPATPTDSLKQPDLIGEAQEEVDTELQIIQSEQTQETATLEETEFGQVKNLVVSFAERFGSYSNQADFKNLIELKSLMTVEMKVKTDNLIFQSRRNNPISENYYAQTAKALSTKATVYDGNSSQAEFIVKCQRQETIGSPDNARTYYQDIKITLVKVGDTWRVDSASWQ